MSTWKERLSKWKRSAVSAALVLLWKAAGHLSTAEFVFDKARVLRAVSLSDAITVVLLVAFGWFLVGDLRRSRGELRPPHSEPSPARLPEKRPKVVPSRYGDASGNATGKTIGESLVLDNDGEPAFDVSIEPIEFGGWTLRFDGVSRLTKTAECTAYIFRGAEQAVQLYEPWKQWWQEGLGGKKPSPELDLIINYRDFDGVRYRTLAKLKRDMMQSSGWSVIFIRQEIMAPAKSN